MKTEERIRIQRDWFWTLAGEFERKAEDEDGPDAVAAANLAHEFAMVVGTLDWVLDEAAPDED